MNEKSEAIPKSVSEKRGIMHSAPSPCPSLACRCVLACSEKPVDGSEDPTEFDGRVGQASCPQDDKTPGRWRDRGRGASRGLGAQADLALLRLGAGAVGCWSRPACVCLQESASMSSTWQCWTKRSTRAATHAAPGKTVSPPLFECQIGGYYRCTFLMPLADDVVEQVSRAAVTNVPARPPERLRKEKRPTSGDLGSRASGLGWNRTSGLRFRKPPPHPGHAQPLRALPDG